MRIDPSLQSKFSGTSGTRSSGTSKNTFQNILASTHLKNEFKQVSADLKSGKITEEQASQQFVNLVLEKKSELKLSAPDLKKIQEAVGGLMSQDPSFVSKLQAELKKI